MSRGVYIIPLWLRLWHWTNAALVVALTASGISLHYSGEHVMLIPFALAREVHNIAGVALCVAYAVFAVGNVVTGNWWQYVPKPQGFWTRVAVQARFYLFGIFRGEHHPYPPTPEANFNALQQLVYWVVMYLLMPALLTTGIMFLWPELAPDRIGGLDGLVPVAVAHYVVGFLIALFLVGHVYLATTGTTPTSLIRMMLTGWHRD